MKKSGEAKEKIQRAKWKAQTPVVGNMDPLLDALSAIVDETGIDLNASENETHQKVKKKNSRQRFVIRKCTCQNNVKGWREWKDSASRNCKVLAIPYREKNVGGLISRVFYSSGENFVT